MTDSLNVDPAGLAPASLGANTNMLLYTSTGPSPQIDYITLNC